MSTRPNMRTMQMQDTIDRQKKRIAALEAENARMREAINKFHEVWSGPATTDEGNAMSDMVLAALATGSEAKP